MSKSFLFCSCRCLERPPYIINPLFGLRFQHVSLLGMALIVPLPLLLVSAWSLRL